MKSIVKDIIIVAICVAVIWIGLQAYFGAVNPFYVVSSGSMYPQLAMYDIIVITGHTPFEDIKVGDIIVFDRPKDHDKVIVHRVVAVVDDDPKTLRTKGDNNQASIPGTDFPITEQEYVGTVVHVIPQVGSDGESWNHEDNFKYTSKKRPAEAGGRVTGVVQDTYPTIIY